MSVTPAGILAAKNSALAKEIKHMSEKWSKRTRKLCNPWPSEGTFDVAACDNLELRIQDHKADGSKKRQQKREKEIQILDLFRNEGKIYRQNFKQAILKMKDKLDKPQKEVKAPAEEGLYPLLGTVTITGDFDLRDTFDKGPKGLDVDNGILKLTTSQQSDEAPGKEKHAKGSEEREFEQTTPPRGTDPKYCSTERRAVSEEGRREIDCFAEHKDFLKRQPKANSYWIDLENKDEDVHDELNDVDQIIQDISEGLRKSLNHITGTHSDEVSENTTSTNKEKNFKPFYKPGIHSPERGDPNTGLTQEKEKPGPSSDNRDLRPRHDVKLPIRYTNDGQYPILIKGTRANYIPWQSLDLTGLVSRLPHIQDGAGKWIRAFEQETTGLMLALGDLKAILARVVGTSAMGTLLASNGVQWMLDPMADGTEFNTHRNALWNILRAAYPNRIDPKALKGEPLSETESPASFVDRQLRRWKLETEEGPEGTPIMTSLFRTSLISALPTPVRDKLEDVVGLDSMPHVQFRDHVVHTVDRYRKDNNKMIEQEKCAQRKLTQLHINDLQHKVKTQAAVVKSDSKSDSQTQALQTAVAPPQTPSQPVINVYPNQYGRQQPGPQRRFPNRFPNRYPTRQGWVQQNRPPLPGSCWGCGQMGHLYRDCPNPIPNPEWSGRGRGTRPNRGRGGPVNPWAAQQGF
nr:uncharacterized protein LOC129155805 [Nothobranchius furzeri]